MCADTTDQTPDYKDTLNLPKTDFPMRAGLPKREPQWLEKWANIGVYDTLRSSAAGREPFILHDGPPDANGNLHIGHALNKILKDMVVRSQQMMGKDARGRPKKRRLGAWMTPVLGGLARLKGLRGTPFDVFGYAHERRQDVALIAWFEARLTSIANGNDDAAQMRDALRAPMAIRGYGPVREKAVAQILQDGERV